MPISWKVAGEGRDRCGSLATIGRPLFDFLPETTKMLEPVSTERSTAIPARSALAIALSVAWATASPRPCVDQLAWPFPFAGCEVSPGRIEGACANGSLRTTSSKNSLRPSKPRAAPAVWYAIRRWVFVRSPRSKESPNASSFVIATESSAVQAGTCALVSSRAAYSEGSGLAASHAFTPFA